MTKIHSLKVLFFFIFLSTGLTLKAQVVTLASWEFDHIFLFTDDGTKLLEYDYDKSRDIRIWKIPENTRGKTIRTENTFYYNFRQKENDIYAFKGGYNTEILKTKDGKFAPELLTNVGGIIDFDESGENMFLYREVSDYRAEILYYNIASEEVLWKEKIKIKRYGHVESLLVGPENTIIIKLYEDKEFIFQSYKVLNPLQKVQFFGTL